MAFPAVNLPSSAGIFDPYADVAQGSSIEDWFNWFKDQFKSTDPSIVLETTGMASPQAHRLCHLFWLVPPAQLCSDD